MTRAHFPSIVGLWLRAFGAQPPSELCTNLPLGTRPPRLVLFIMIRLKKAKMYAHIQTWHEAVFNPLYDSDFNLSDLGPV